MLIWLSDCPHPKGRNSGCSTSAMVRECYHRREEPERKARRGRDQEVAGIRTEVLPRCTLPRPRPVVCSSQHQPPLLRASSGAWTRWEATGPGETRRESPSLSQDSSEGASQRQGAGLRRRFQQSANGELCVSKAEPRSALTSLQALSLMGVVVFFLPRSNDVYLGCGHQGALWWWG